MEIKGYKQTREKKTIIQPCRMDDSMLDKLYEINDKTGISVSELIRESIRQLILQVEETGQVTFRFR